MKCEICHKKDASAVVHLDGKELYVCKDCAGAASGKDKRGNLKTHEIKMPENFKGRIHIAGDEPPPEIMNALLKATMKFVEDISKTAPEAAEKIPQKCPDCNTSREDIEKTSMLGCPTCYNVFAPLIRKKLLSSQYGKRHIGSSPSGAKTEKDIETLKRKLQLAVKKEQYETASRIQKEIDRLTNKAKGEQ
jgi:protein-arginine kinase activator protein McsA